MKTNQEWSESLWQEPPSIYRSAPFWAWNAELSAERLCRQIEQMHAAGMGGFFMHSRYGLKTAYLSDDWYGCISACVAKARELGMKAYLYDEDRWPSGTAGGLVTRGRPGNCLSVLVAARTDEFAPELDPQGSFAVRCNPEGQVLACRALAEGEGPDESERLMAFAVGTAEPEPWFNDAAYLDTFNPDAVAEFILANYQPYADRYGEDFGTLIPAFFTDEPNFSQGHLAAPGRIGTAPWTAQLPREFLRRRGYDLRDHLVELFAPTAGQPFSKVRMDYYRTLTELFTESFSAQIGQWCERHDIALTGHYLLEEAFAPQFRHIGAAMPHYEHQQWPGIDILTDQRREISTVKQCSSVADQMGRERVLSELYGCTGWDWPLEGHKFNAGWQYVLGVNFRCPHLSLYSLAGGAKRDFPASIFPHSPWWKHYRTVEDYFARLSLMLTQGRAVRDVLVIHPIDSAWALPMGSEPARKLTESFDSLLVGLLDAHYDYDLGDESLLARHAHVAKDQFRLGQMTYRLVVVPPSLTLRKTTVELLGRLLDSGGSVLVAGAPADRVDGEPSEAVGALASRAACCGGDASQIVAAIESVLDRRVSVTEGDGQALSVWTMLRTVKGGQLLFVQSHDRQGAHDVHVSVQGRRPVVLWDAATGVRRRVASKVVGDRVEFELSLPPTGSALVSLGLHVAKAKQVGHAPVVVSAEQRPGPWRVKLCEPNTFPLDYCRYRVEDGELSEPVPVLLADERIRAHWRLGTRTAKDCQPWYLAQTGRFDDDVRGPAAMHFGFHVTDVPAAFQVAIERPEDFRISLNGRPVDNTPTGWWVDEDLKTVDLSGAVGPGDNELVLAFDYRSDMELEDLHLLGDFGVRRRGDRPVPGAYTLTALPGKLSAGSWVGQGLDFYGGAVNYRLKVPEEVWAAISAGRRVRLALPDVRCTCAAVHVGEQTIVLAWPPMVADITAELLAQHGPICDEVTVEVIGGRKNILGPLHAPWIDWTGPSQFDPHYPDWTDEYLLTDHGLMAPPAFEIVK